MSPSINVVALKLKLMSKGNFGPCSCNMFFFFFSPRRSAVMCPASIVSGCEHRGRLLVLLLVCPFKYGDAFQAMQSKMSVHTFYSLVFVISGETDIYPMPEI